MKKSVVIYHANCADGVAAAWAAWVLLKDDAEYIPGYYGMEIPNVDGKTVFLVDFSFKRHQLHEMSEKAKAIVVLDHHISAIQDLQGIDLFRDNVNIAHCTTEKSGCQIAWDYFHGNVRPALLDTVADRDLWQFKLKNTKEIMAWVMSHELTIEIFDKLVNDYDFFAADAFNAGAAVLSNQEKHVKSLRKNLTFIEFGDYPNMPTINCNGMFASDLGNLIAEEYFVALMYYIDKEGIKISLRSAQNGPDVSVVANKYGGGGHKHAAGFKLKLLSREASDFFAKIQSSSLTYKL